MPDSPHILGRLEAELAAHPPPAAGRLWLPTPPGAAAAALAWALARVLRPPCLLVIAPGELELEDLRSDWEVLCGSPSPLVLPSEEPDDPDDGVQAACRRETVRRMVSAAPRGRVVLSCVNALLQPVAEPREVASREAIVAAGEDMPFDHPRERLSAMGYRRVREVVCPGTFAERGGILDIWPPGETAPARIERFGDRIDSLRAFDPRSQRSTGTLARLAVPPGREALAEVSEVSPLSLFPEHGVVFWPDRESARTHLELHAGREAGPEAWTEFIGRVRARAPTLEILCEDAPVADTPAWPLELVSLPGLAEVDAARADPDARARTRGMLLEELRRQAAEGTVLIRLDTPGILEKFTAESGIEPAPETRPPPRPGNGFDLRVGVLSGGFQVPAAGLTAVSQADLYGRLRGGRRPVPASGSGAFAGERLDRPEDIAPGDLVVHLDHGIGRFIGFTEIDSGGRRIEVLTIAYAEGARLHVPVSQIHLLSRYVGVSASEARLHRLGGGRWRREKIHAERAVVDLAASLLETQAHRDAAPGTAFDVNPPWMHAFETSFPYRETEDQERAIREVKHDMARARPMDRLICGDAGYGKTEVAMRAAFIAVMQARQVAVLTPTTVLAQQHFDTFRDRMAPYPVRIEMLSRFRAPARRREILRELAEGRIDIVIGTHGLLGARVAFKDLGLVVVDEEQRFGVRHKEMLKQVRKTVDVLTLSATPIPRTLYLSMSGARDMSLLRTPPRERVAVQNRVERDSDAVIRQAILRELNREGQVFFLYNRVMTIEAMHRRLRELAPEARIAVAHGRMAANELAGVMHDFAEGRFDVLLCTTIIESGVDIPRANTMIIHRADRFGIADLYQLRGRVGRAARQAWVYFLLPPGGVVESAARARIAALRRHSGLGAGFNLALRDLEIRGAGNLLGAAQSGHIAAVGFGLYCQLLRRAVARLKGEQTRIVELDLQLDFIEFSPSPSSGAEAALPYPYVENESDRIALLRQLAEANSNAELEALRRDLADRFGPLPPAAERLLRVGEIRIRGAERGVKRIEVREGVVRAFGRDGSPLRLDGERHRHPLQSRDPDERLAELLRLLG